MISDFIFQYKNYKKLKDGFGPFKRNTIQSFVHSTCESCGIHISESSLLGNALVIENYFISIKCSHCRTGEYHTLYNDHPFNTDKNSKANNTVDRKLLICEIYDFMITKKTHMTWMDILLCLRGGNLQYTIMNGIQALMSK